MAFGVRGVVQALRVELAVETPDGRRGELAVTILEELFDFDSVSIDPPTTIAPAEAGQAGWRGSEKRRVAASNLRAHSESEVGAPVVTGGPHDAAISESSERQRAAKSRRCSARGIESPRPRRQRKYCRNSSNAEQKRAADAKLPKPRIG